MCENDDITKHNGIYCNIMDWETEQAGKVHRLDEIIKRDKEGYI
jgi:hypothetical protein